MKRWQKVGVAASVCVATALTTVALVTISQLSAPPTKQQIAEERYVQSLPIGTDRIRPGLVLGWKGRTYVLTAKVVPWLVGTQLGIASYHGDVAGGFTVYSLKFWPPSTEVVFRAGGQQTYWAAVATTNSSP